MHSFQKPVANISLPDKFTYPFHYTPHPLCLLAVQEIQGHILTQTQWLEELENGKMFGVLIVKNRNEEIGYLAAFSGNLAGKCLHPYFVPPIYDLSVPNGFFKPEEEKISAINKKIQDLETAPFYTKYKENRDRECEQAQQALTNAKLEMKDAKERREIRKRNNPSETEKRTLIQESQFQKAEYKRLERYWKSSIDAIQSEIDTIESDIENLKMERKKRSAILQLKLFDQFQLLNARGETIGLSTLFKQTVQKVPPAGAGECAAPKLLQYAYQNKLQPLAMAEFWWGNSPKTEIRRHGNFYPACKGKCEPILTHMLIGLEVEENPLKKNTQEEAKLEIIYEDDWLLVVNKPAGILSVPGKSNSNSIYDRIKSLYPAATGPLIVHRLDMATSGLLLIAKTKEVHQHLQAQFKNRTIKKKYTAILDGILSEKEGIIQLPLRLNPDDRPRQVIDEIHGKPAITKYQVVEYMLSQTRVTFYPLTGRTHQLRVHAAHQAGLNAPISGDELYGKKAERLFLHAESLEFKHPVSGKIIRLEKKANF